MRGARGSLAAVSVLNVLEGRVEDIFLINGGAQVSPAIIRAKTPLSLQRFQRL